MQAALGYAFSSAIDTQSMWASETNIVPYAAANYNGSKAAGKPTKYTAKTLDFGVALVADDILRGPPFRFSALHLTI